MCTVLHNRPACDRLYIEEWGSEQKGDAMEQERRFDRKEEAQEFARLMVLCGATSTAVLPDDGGWVCLWTAAQEV